MIRAKHSFLVFATVHNLKCAHCRTRAEWDDLARS